MMRYSQAERMEIIRLVEESELSVTQTLEEMGVPQSKFYRWSGGPQAGARDQVKVEHRPRLLSDNGPSFVSKPLRDYLQEHKIKHIRSAPYHPMTQGEIERYHRSMKNIVKLDPFYFPWHFEKAITDFVEYYNHRRYHEALDNMTPADV